MTPQEFAEKEIQAFQWMADNGYDRRACKDIAPILVNYGKWIFEHSRSTSDISPIIHSQPQPDFKYWVKFYDEGKYQVADCELVERNNTLYFILFGNYKKVSEVSDWKRQPIIFNEADYG